MRILAAVAVTFACCVSNAFALQSPSKIAPAAAVSQSPADEAEAKLRAELAQKRAEADEKRAEGKAATSGEQQPADTTEAQKKAEDDKKKAERLRKVQQLQFDRRPSAILKAWSAPPDKPDEKKDEQKTAPTDKTGDPTSGEPTPAPDPLDAELKLFQRNVTLGNWADVKAFLASLGKDEAKAAYLRLLVVMRTPPQPQQGQPQPQDMPVPMQPRGQPAGPFAEKFVFSIDDVIALADVAPLDLEKDSIAHLGAILRLTLDSGTVVERFMERLRAEVARTDPKPVLTPRQATKFLFAATLPVEAGEFLPELEKAKADKDHEALNLLSRHLLALHAKEKRIEHLERAWHVTQAIFASAEIQKEEKEEALKRAVELAPKIRDELGQAWLDESFTSRAERGMEIIAAIGSTASTSMTTHMFDADFRLKSLQLQTTAVEALLKSAPERAAEWSASLNLLAANWLKEANFAYTYDRSTSLGPRLQRDPFGNYFYMNDDGEMTMPYQPQQQGFPQAIKTALLLESKPGDKWLEFVAPGLRPKFDMVFAQLYLKVGEEDRSFPYVEHVAASFPAKAKDLVDEFLRVWTRNHDPNANRNRTNYYMFSYGYERRSEGIPLTRSKQERNLTDLSELAKRLRAVQPGELNEELLARAFTTCHSTAEVYRLDAIEKVFGPIEHLKPKTLAELAQQMRANLVGVWRQPAVQQDKKTNRKQKDIEAEVTRGYRMAGAMVADALEKHPGDWSLLLARASILHDENNYRNEIAKSSDYSAQRDEALSEFRRAAESYAGHVSKLSQDEETTKAFELWFYASLGATDLGQVTEEAVPDLRQPAIIREAIQSLPGEAAERHMAMFANSLFTRMSAAKPSLKFRYLRTGFEIVGDHKQAAEARKVLDYYKDLVTEIKLEAVVDGSGTVGHDEPFGLFVNLRHTREIERESGGFGRYLQNQNNARYSYNYGRPTENYRDKFEEMVRQALGEHFDVKSVTFQDEKVNSKATQEYGWRVTPYAYVLAKARGPQVDRIPPLRLDLDFLDTSGYAILPIESPAVPIDAAPDRGDERPLKKLQVTQTLDERQADKGKLVLEVKATAQGLVPPLDDILDLRPGEFDIVETDDQGLSVSKFDPDSDDTTIVSERTWLVSMKSKPDLPEPPKTFRFGTARSDSAEVTYQRYDDADLATAEEEISLAQKYGEPRSRWPWAIAAVPATLGAILLVIFSRRRRPTTDTTHLGIHMPTHVNAFTVLGLLKEIQQTNGFAEPHRHELDTAINRLEQHYFADIQDGEPDLHELAESWVRRSQSNSN